MNQTPAVHEKRTVPAPTGGGFRLVIVVVTALVFAVVFGWLACMHRTENGEVEFHWHWTAWLWITIGIACTVYFWRQIWPVQNVSPTGAIRRQVKGWTALLVPSLMWLAYPLRFISGAQLLNVFLGLAIAATVLALGGWMVFQLIKGFADDPAPPAKMDSPIQPEIESDAKK